MERRDTTPTNQLSTLDTQVPKKVEANKDVMKNVNRHTRAGKNGKVIYCPCGKNTTVYHFSWIAITCKGCNQMVYKEEWKYE